MAKRKVTPADYSKPADASRRPTEAASSIIRANVSRQAITSPTFASLYSNDTQIQVTPWDVRLIFGEISEPPTAERPSTLIKQTGEVRMSPQHAKILVMLLLQQLKYYEETIGPIPLPASS